MTDPVRRERVATIKLAMEDALALADLRGPPDKAAGYRQFSSEVANRGLKILITELDVLDDGLPADSAERDAAVAETYRLYLDTALAEPAVAAVITFGLSDRYTWLQEDYPREDEEPRRPLPFDDELQPKPAYDALQGALASALPRDPLWQIPRAE